MITSTTQSLASRVSQPSGRSTIALCGLLATVASGCTQAPLCPELSDCGGPPPIGDWALSAGHPSCTEDLYVPPTDTRLLGGEVPAARVPTVEPAFYDWCYLLVAGGGTSIQLKAPRFFYESGPIGAASISYQAGTADGLRGTFSAGLTRTGTFTFDFPAVCMRAFGAEDGKPVDPADPASPAGDVCKQLEVPLRASGLGEGSYRNTTCVANPSEPAGCLCSFDVTETGGPVGRYEVLDSKTILHYSSNNFPAKVTYCNTGNRLELTGAEGDYLFGVAGLRTLDLGKVSVNCADGMQGPGEEGVDCGGSCPMACMPPAMP